MQQVQLQVDDINDALNNINIEVPQIQINPLADENEVTESESVETPLVNQKAYDE